MGLARTCHSVLQVWSRVSPRSKCCLSVSQETRLAERSRSHDEAILWPSGKCLVLWPKGAFKFMNLYLRCMLHTEMSEYSAATVMLRMLLVNESNSPKFLALEPAKADFLTCGVCWNSQKPEGVSAEFWNREHGAALLCIRTCLAPCPSESEHVTQK